jgi:hypothetical protein
MTRLRVWRTGGFISLAPSRIFNPGSSVVEFLFTAMAVEADVSGFEWRMG